MGKLLALELSFIAANIVSNPIRYFLQSTMHSNIKTLRRSGQKTRREISNDILIRSNEVKKSRIINSEKTILKVLRYAFRPYTINHRRDCE
ncbi:hypothetical protein BpHYR1_045452 [Brachionus plicatilis]|uniref:Uncharacterized protein n=1 Tax=Brachionus plicatilis TaxID=10195 RepID=A0A3M7T4J3_BRAPC|nr:hypothetical protein BpHYR1_045452 [Brachionus plicatilis]